MRNTWKRWALAALIVCTFACNSGQGITGPTWPEDAAPPSPTQPAPQPAPVPAYAPYPPLVGQLKVQGGILSDATGPRRIIGYSDFAALRIFEDNPQEELSTLDAARVAGFQYVRLAYGLAETETQDGGYWRGAMVSPELAKRQLIPFAKAAKGRGIRLHLFGGHAFASPADELDFIRWMANAFGEAGLQDEIALFEWRNEWTLTYPKWLPTYDRTSPFDLARQAALIMYNATGCLTTMGSPGEDDGLIQQTISGVMTVASIDGMRGLSGPLYMKHANGFYYRGRWGGFYKGALLWVTEPSGPNGIDGDVYLPLDDKDYLWGTYATYVITGQVLTYFSGPAVRHRRPIDSVWGFYELPRLLSIIPDDIGTYRGPTWFIKSNQFYAVLAEDWGIEKNPPRAIKHWLMMRASGPAIEGDGPIKVAPGWKAALFKGEFQ